MPSYKRHTIKSLQLDLDAANNGKTWLLLPAGNRDAGSGMTYPLPSRRQELQKLSAIYVPPFDDKRDCGCVYIRRAIKMWKKRQMRVKSAILDTQLRTEAVARSHRHFTEHVRDMRKEVRSSVQEFQEATAKQIANLGDLFSLGREGLDLQMKAYLGNTSINGEIIDSHGFRQCFRIVTQAVKGLGLPSDQRAPAGEAVLEEVAAAIQATQEAVAEAEPIKEDAKPN